MVMVRKWLNMEAGVMPSTEQSCPGPAAEKPPISGPGSFKQRQHEAYVRTASLSLSFSEDVVEARGPDAFPHRRWDLSRIFDPRDVVPPAGRARGRKTRIWTRRIGATCGARAREASGRGRRSRSPSSGPAQPPVAELECQAPEAGATEDEYSRLAALTEPEEPDQPRGSVKWDEFLVKRLSKNTAQWLVSQRIPAGPAKTRLSSLLTQQYGSASTVGLVTDERMSQSDFIHYQQPPEEVRQEASPVQLQLPETGLPTYYRVPGFEQTQSSDGEPGGVNQTAAGLTVKHLALSTPKIKVTSPRHQTYTFITDNQFQRELYSGRVKVVHRNHRYSSWILMDNYSEYKKHLQEMFPQSPTSWHSQQSDLVGLPSTGPQKMNRGAHRWTELPTVANYTSDSGLRPADSQHGLKHLKPIWEPYQTWEELLTLSHTLEEWRKAWKINVRWQDVTVECLKRDLASLHYHIQVIALATCANAAVNRPKINNLTGSYVRGQVNVKPLPAELWPLIVEALSSSNEHVQVAAALCHTAVGDINPQIQAILQGALHHGNEADRWAAAQCLALSGDSSYLVVSCLVKRLFDSPRPDTIEQCCVILGELSKHTMLVHTLLADELNSSNWRNKVLTFNVLSRLKGHINQDLTNKMVYVMWNDWNSHVRHAAASTLGILGLGKVVHDQLRQRLVNGTNRIRVEALAHLGQLGIMTGKLLGPFLSCFNSDFNCVRREACLTAVALRVKDQRVLIQLKRLIQSDPVWTIKAYAIKALGAIGHVTEELKELLLWAVHYEDEPGVRIEACNSIISLGLRDSHVQAVLRDRLLLEPHHLVRGEVKRAIQELDISAEMDQELIQKISNQVKVLCKKELLLWKLLRLEEITQNVSEQFERINLEKQPDQLKKLQNRHYIEHYLDTLAYPSKDRIVDSDPQIQAILEQSSTSLLTCSKKVAKKQDEGPGYAEWIGITARSLVTEKALPRIPHPCYPAAPEPIALKPSELLVQQAIVTGAQSASPVSSLVEEEIEIIAVEENEISTAEEEIQSSVVQEESESFVVEEEIEDLVMQEEIEGPMMEEEIEGPVVEGEIEGPVVEEEIEGPVVEEEIDKSVVEQPSSSSEMEESDEGPEAVEASRPSEVEEIEETIPISSGEEETSSNIEVEEASNDSGKEKNGRDSNLEQWLSPSMLEMLISKSVMEELRSSELVEEPLKKTLMQDLLKSSVVEELLSSSVVHISHKLSDVQHSSSIESTANTELETGSYKFETPVSSAMEDMVSTELEEGRVSAGVKERTVSPGVKERTVSPGVEERTVSPGVEERTVSPGVEERTVRHGAKERTVRHGVEERSESPGEEERTVSPGVKERTVSPGVEERTVSPGVEERTVRHGAKERTVRHGVEERSESPGEEETSVSPGLKERTVSPGLKERTVSPGVKERTVSPGVEERTVSPGVEERTVSPGVEERTVRHGAKERTVRHGVEERSESPGEEERTVSPGVEERTVRRRAKERSVSPGVEERSMSPGVEERSMSPGVEWGQ